MKRYLFLLSLLGLLASCEKPILSEDYVAPKGNLTLKVSPYSMTTRSASLGESFTKINAQFFSTSNATAALSKVYTQTTEDENFGTLSFNLAPSTYRVIVVGHSSTRSATIAYDKISFTAANGKKITDTFWYCDTIMVTEEASVRTIDVDRTVAMFRLKLTDEVPETVSQFEFYYTGGSADFNPKTGNGITNSKQSEIREVNDENIYEVFTFPKDNNKLKVKVSALDESGTIIATKEFQDVPVKANSITTYQGAFFDGNTVVSGNSISITVNSEWDEENKFNF